MKMTGAEMVVKTLEKNGVSVVFGYPGAANCPFIDKLSHSKIKHILSRNEQGACHMASGYARVTKQTGVCTATSGPGATNLLTGIATAYMDSVPLVAITGQVALPLVGKDAFQEVDITGASIPFTKHNYLVKDGMELQRIVDEAFFIAGTGRPGPVLIDIPVDIQKQEYDYPAEDKPVNIRGYKLIGKANEGQVRKVAEAIRAAKQPVILAGGGVVNSDAVQELRKFVRMTRIPVVSTMTGIGVLPSDDALYFGMIGSHGMKRANMVLNHSDLVLIMGARLGDRSIANAQRLETRTRLVHIDIDPAEIGKSVQPHIPVVGDVKDVLKQLLPQIEGYQVPAEWLEYVAKIKVDWTVEEPHSDTGYVNPKYFMKRLSEKVQSDAYVATEVGQNQIWATNHYIFKDPRHLITSAGFGTMGYGLPAAIGAACGTDKTVFAVMGDGSFQMDLPELGTMCQWEIPVKMVLFENKRLGMVHEHQFMHYNSNFQAVQLDGSPDFAKLAEAYGIPSAIITENSQVDAGIDRLIAGKEPFLLIVSVDPFEPTGGALNESKFKKEAK